MPAPSARRWASLLVPHLRAQRAWWISFAVFGALGSLWALSSPLMSIPDEPAHTVRAVSLVHGQLRGDDVRVVSDDPSSPSRLDSHVRVPRAYAELDRLRSCYNFSARTPAGCAPPVGTDKSDADASSYTGTYPPLYYALVGWPSLVLSPHRALYAMRLCSVAVCSALLASALVSARRLGTGGPGVAAVALSVTPLVLFLVGSINPSGFEIAAALATWASVLDLVRRRGPAPARLVTRAVVATCCFAAVRPLSPVFAVLVVAIVLLASASRARLAELAGDRRVRVGGAVIGAVLVLSGAWVVWSKAYDSFAGNPQPGLGFGAALRGAWDLESWHTQQMFGVFGWLDAPSPWGLVTPWLVAGGLMVGAALGLGTWRQRAVLTAWLAATIAIPLVGEASRAERYGYIWQGRYTLPLAVGLPLLAAWILSSWGATHRASPTPARVLRGASLIVVGGMAIGQLIAHGIALTRYVVAEPGVTAFRYLSGDGWEPPIAATGLFALAVAGCAAYAVWLGLLTRAGRTSR